MEVEVIKFKEKLYQHSATQLLVDLKASVIELKDISFELHRDKGKGKGKALTFGKSYIGVKCSCEEKSKLELIKVKVSSFLASYTPQADVPLPVKSAANTSTGGAGGGAGAMAGINSPTLDSGYGKALTKAQYLEAISRKAAIALQAQFDREAAASMQSQLYKHGAKINTTGKRERASGSYDGSARALKSQRPAATIAKKASPSILVVELREPINKLILGVDEAMKYMDNLRNIFAILESLIPKLGHLSAIPRITRAYAEIKVRLNNMLQILELAASYFGDSVLTDEKSTDEEFAKRWRGLIYSAPMSVRNFRAQVKNASDTLFKEAKVETMADGSEIEILFCRDLLLKVAKDKKIPITNALDKNAQALFLKFQQLEPKITILKSQLQNKAFVKVFKDESKRLAYFNEFSKLHDLVILLGSSADEISTDINDVVMPAVKGKAGKAVDLELEGGDVVFSSTSAVFGMEQAADAVGGGLAYMG